MNFDVKTVRLTGKNLIEASAGTGKTYSIAILVLRILLERNVKIKELLLVTFTDAAVAELDDRVRNFLRSAKSYLDLGTAIDDKTISELVDRAVKTVTKEEVTLRLSDALVFLDEVQITTIHGFCNAAQKQFAFETDQLFEKELIADEAHLVEGAINEFWRTKITSLPVEYLKTLFDVKFGKEELLKSVRSSLSGKIFISENKTVEEVWGGIESKSGELDEGQTNAIDYIKELSDAIDTLPKATKGAYEKLINKPDEFIAKVCDAIETEKKYISKFPEDFLDVCTGLIEDENELKQLQIELKSILHHQVIAFVEKHLLEVKKQKSLQSYDDMITGLHQAVTSEDNEKIIKQLKKRYKVVFIDEFQDTDRVQYEIFYEAFGNHTYDIMVGVYPSTVFYIGDPKQSIYAFRQANLKTYNLAKSSSQVFDMDTNFRSVPDYVSAMNAFFEPQSDYPFFKDERIKYINVNASSKWSDNQELTVRGLDTKPFAFIGYGYGKSGLAYQNIAFQVLELLKDGKIKDRRIVPTDIGVLVRSGKQAKEIKKQLAIYNVPAVVVDDSQVLKSNEAKTVKYILELLLEQDRSNLNRVLLTTFTAYTAEDLIELNLAKELMRFSSVPETFATYGIYPALMSFIDLYDSNEALAKKIPHLADRAMSNFIQLAELCNKRQLTYNDDLASLITWLNKEYSRKEKTSEYEQRLESDKNAVNIVTIHKSKGLDYNIVLTFFPNMGGGAKDVFIDYQNEESGMFEYSFKGVYPESEEQKEIQDTQEIMRLWYVAITRAVYKSYVYFDTAKKLDGKIMATHVSVLSALDNYHEFFEELDLEVEELEAYEPELEQLEGALRETNNKLSFKSDWSISSYSSIRKKEEHVVKNKVVLDDLTGYDDFVFHKMPRGANFGNFMHLIFEEIDFDNPQQIKDFLHSKIGTPFAHKILTEETVDDYEEMVKQVLHTEFKDEKGHVFPLTAVLKKLPEMEFFFDIDDFKENELKKQFDKPFDFQFDSYTGFVNGFVDLIFKLNNRYYILDWKSNHLGDDIDAYNAEGLEQTMTDSNYHLQYFIYTISVCRYLKQIDPGFDYDRDFGGVFYVFVRGCREGERTGIFYNKPNIESVMNYI